MFWFLLAAFTVVLAVILYLILWEKGETWVKVALSLIEGVIGWSIRRVVKFLFPSPRQKQEKG